MAHGLTREAPAEQIHRRQIPGGDGLDIVVAGDMRPVLGKDTAAVGIGFNLPLHGMPRPLQTQVQTADAAKQRAHGHCRRLPV